jgi:hypothetical protein
MVTPVGTNNITITDYLNLSNLVFEFKIYSLGDEPVTPGTLWACPEGVECVSSHS